MSVSGSIKKVMSGTNSIENHSSLRLLKLLLKAFGMWPIENSREKLISDLSSSYTIAIVSIGFIAQCIDFYYSFGNVQVLAYKLPITISGLVIFFKLCKLMLNRSDIMEFNAYIEKTFWKVEYNTEEYQILDEYNRKSIVLVIVHFIFAQSVVVLFVSMPIAETSGMNVSERLLPINVYFNLPFTKSPYYEITFFLEAAASIVVGLCTTTVASFLGTTNFYTAGQFKILQRRLELSFHDVTSDKADKPLVTTKINSNHSNVCDCIKQHQMLISHMEKMESLYTMILFAETFVCVIGLCFSGFQIVLADVDTSLFRLFFSIQFLFITAVDLFLYAWPCQEVIEESLKISTGAYGSSWYCLPYTKEGRLCRQSMMIVIMRARKPCVLTAGKFTPMSLQTFGSVFNSALSYFTVLRQMNEDNDA